MAKSSYWKQNKSALIKIQQTKTKESRSIKIKVRAGIYEQERIYEAFRTTTSKGEKVQIDDITN